MNKKIIPIIATVIIVGVVIALIGASGIATNNKNMPVNEIETEQTPIKESTQGKNYTISLHDGITATSP